MADMGDLLEVIFYVIWFFWDMLTEDTRKQRRSRRKRRKILREIEKRYEQEHLEEYRKCVEDTYRSITGGQTLPAERTNLVEEGHRGVLPF
jgi:hypothetical protein